MSVAIPVNARAILAVAIGLAAWEGLVRRCR